MSVYEDLQEELKRRQGGGHRSASNGAAAPANDTFDVAAILSKIRNGAQIGAPRPPVDYPIKGLAMAAGPVTLFYAYSYSGKSIALQDLLLSVASGQRVWGQFTCSEGPVLHLDYEQYEAETDDRYQRLARAREIDLAAVGPSLAYLNGPREGLYLNEPGARDVLLRLCEGRSMVLIDTLAAALPGMDEIDKRIAEPIYMLGEVSEQTGAVIILAHHTAKATMGKDAADMDPRLQARGSGAIFGAAGYAYLMGGKEGEAKLVKQTKGRNLGAPRSEDFYLRLEQVDVRPMGYSNKSNPADLGGFAVRYRTREQEEEARQADPRAELEREVQQVVEVVRRNAGAEGLRGGKGELAKLAKMNAQTCRTAVDVALGRGLIRNAGTERRPVYFPGAPPPS
jgi:hypothetical protein